MKIMREVITNIGKNINKGKEEEIGHLFSKTSRLNREGQWEMNLARKVTKRLDLQISCN